MLLLDSVLTEAGIDRSVTWHGYGDAEGNISVLGHGDMATIALGKDNIHTTMKSPTHINYYMVLIITQYQKSLFIGVRLQTVYLPSRSNFLICPAALENDGHSAACAF